VIFLVGPELQAGTMKINTLNRIKLNFFEFKDEVTISLPLIFKLDEHFVSENFAKL
jgi:hypothetical protein